ncbi:MAG: bifunctional metallophosphatase/5'-nucleotidase [Acidobacteria bacterium]|nr:bifunctional metallophosphatase/5'-nucleotidase [Acidobacteriota bacterium]
MTHLTYICGLLLVFSPFSLFAKPAQPIVPQSKPKTVSILFFNDAHQVMPISDHLGIRGGVARLKTIIDQVKHDNPNTLVAFGGDLAGGLLFGAVFHGHPQVLAFNQLPVDVASFGQHDFDFGSAETRKLVAESKFAWITSNLVEQSGQPFAGVPRYLIREAGGLKIGFIGLTDDFDTTLPENIVTQQNILQSAKSAASSLRKQGADLIFALCQADMSKNLQMLEQIPDIDAVFGEEQSENRSIIQFANNRPVLSPCGNIGSVVQLDIELNQGKYVFSVRVHSVDETVVSDPELLKIEHRYQTELDTKLARPLAQVKTPLLAGYNTDHALRRRETNIGNFVTDAFRHHFGTEIGLINSGGIRAEAEGPTFTLKNAVSLLPFGNRLVVAKYTGAQLRQALEHGTSRVEINGGRLLLVSGLSYEFDPRAPIGRRIQWVKVQGKPLKDDQIYRVALPNFLQLGGEGFDMFKTDTLESEPPNGWPVDVDVLSEYARTLGVIDVGIQGRIVAKDQLKSE